MKNNKKLQLTIAVLSFILYNVFIFYPAIASYFLDYDRIINEALPSGYKEESSPVILSIYGESLNKYEEALIKAVKPYGILLLAYNIESKEQLARLRKNIEDITGRKIVFFTDQEGGRVNRFKKVFPDKKYPAPYYYNNIATNDIEKSKKMVAEDAVNTAKDFKYLGIDVNLGLILDVLGGKELLERTNGAISSFFTKYDIGDRSFSTDEKVVKALSEEYIKAFKSEGVDICAKHFIGLGSSTVNTHRKLAVISKTKEELEKDLMPFRNLKDVKYGMLAHAIYTVIDPKMPAPFSKKVIDFIRNDLKFDGILISDAMNMGALGGISLKKKIKKSLEAGVDLILIMDIPYDEKGLKYLISEITSVENDEQENKISGEEIK